MASLPSPRVTLDRGLRVPGLREESDSPLSADPTHARSHRPVAAQRLQAAWPRHSGLSDTLHSRSPHCVVTSPSRLPRACPDAHAVSGNEIPMPLVYDTVRIGCS